MTFAEATALRCSIVLLAGLVGHLACRHRSPALRHAILTVTVVAAIIVVPLSLVLPAVDVPVLSEPAAANATTPVTDVVTLDAPGSATVPAAAPVAAAAIEDLPWRALALWAWGLGSAVGVVLLLGAYVRLARISARATPIAHGPWHDALAAIDADVDPARPVSLVSVPYPHLLATWGWRRPVVLVPAIARDWPAGRIQAVLAHELAHVRRHDWIVNLQADALRALLWWNPLAWLVCRRLRDDSELACDDAVLAAGVPPSRYAADLVDIARAGQRHRRSWITATPMARPSTLQRRIVAMLNPRLDRSLPTRRMTLGLAAAIVLVLLPAAVLRGAQAGPQPLEGVVYDPTGAVVPSVKVTLVATGNARTTVETDAAGHFAFDAVAPGKYQLETALPGFRSLRQPLELKGNGDWNRAITMQIGDLKETISVRGSRMNVAAPADNGPAPVRVGGNIRVPKKLESTNPVYPERMREAGREGRVPLEAIIGLDGRVASVRVATADIHPDFAMAAIDAVRQWRFSPTLLNGRPVEVMMTVTIDFTLE
jgi:TonB family protein